MKRRAKVCARNPEAGPGSCWWWWEGCPAKVAECSLRPLDLTAWLIELDRQTALMRAATPNYQRFDAHGRRLTAAQLRHTHDQGALIEVERRLRQARRCFGGLSGHLHWLDRVWSREELGVLIVEATNRGRQLIAEILGRPVREAGPRFDPALIPDERLDALIQRHRDMAVVEACRAERARRAQLAVAA